MTPTELKAAVRKMATADGYEGQLAPEVLEECASIYGKYVTEDGDEKPRFWRAPNGKKSNLSRILWLLVRTTAFKTWFGKSVVLDENGEPRVMWHGSQSGAIGSFSPRWISPKRSLMTLWSGPGFYFAPEEAVGDIYARGNADGVHPYFIRLENPLRVGEDGDAAIGSGISKAEAERIFLAGDNTQWLDVTLSSILAREDAKYPRAYYKAMKRERRVRAYVDLLKTDVVRLKTVSQAFGAKSQKKLLETICTVTGHDGVIHTIAPGVTEFVVYDPKAIKSADGNDGHFSRKTTKVEDGGAEVEQSAHYKDLTKDRKGSEMTSFKNLIGTLSHIKTNEKTLGVGMDRGIGMDIVDRNGRHHERKGIPEGGEYETEEAYRTGTQKVEHFIREAGRGAQGEEIRKMCQSVYARMGDVDTKNSEFQPEMRQWSHSKAVERLKGKTKGDLIDAAHEHYRAMKAAADQYEKVKNMSRDVFNAWLASEEGKQFATPETMSLMKRKGTAQIKDNEGKMVDQDHEIWEEAKYQVGRTAIAHMLQFMAHSDAINGVPEGMLKNEEERAEKREAAGEEPAAVGGEEKGEGEGKPEDLAKMNDEEFIAQMHPKFDDGGNWKGWLAKAIRGDAVLDFDIRRNINFLREEAGKEDRDLPFGRRLPKAVGLELANRLEKVLERREGNGGRNLLDAARHANAINGRRDVQQAEEADAEKEFVPGVKNRDMDRAAMRLADLARVGEPQAREMLEGAVKHGNEGFIRDNLVDDLVEGLGKDDPVVKAIARANGWGNGGAAPVEGEGNAINDDDIRDAVARVARAGVPGDGWVERMIRDAREGKLQNLGVPGERDGENAEALGAILDHLPQNHPVARMLNHAIEQYRANKDRAAQGVAVGAAPAAGANGGDDAWRNEPIAQEHKDKLFALSKDAWEKYNDLRAQDPNSDATRDAFSYAKAISQFLGKGDPEKGGAAAMPGIRGDATKGQLVDKLNARLSEKFDKADGDENNWEYQQTKRAITDVANAFGIEPERLDWHGKEVATRAPGAAHEPQAEARAIGEVVPGVNEDHVNDAVRKFAGHHGGRVDAGHFDELADFLRRAQRGELDLAPARVDRLRANDRQFIKDIEDAVGKDHPVAKFLNEAMAKKDAENGAEVPRAANPEHQRVVDALHHIGHPEQNPGNGAAPEAENRGGIRIGDFEPANVDDLADQNAIEGELNRIRDARLNMNDPEDIRRLNEHVENVNARAAQIRAEEQQNDEAENQRFREVNFPYVNIDRDVAVGGLFDQNLDRLDNELRNLGLVRGAIRGIGFPPHAKDQISGADIRNAIVAKYQLEQQAKKQDERGDKDGAVRLLNAAYLISHVARKGGGMAQRGDDQRFINTLGDALSNAAKYYKDAYDRAVARHGAGGVANSRGILGAQDGICLLGRILGFDAKFDGDKVLASWAGDQRDGNNDYKEVDHLYGDARRAQGPQAAEGNPNNGNGAAQAGGAEGDRPENAAAPQAVNPAPAVAPRNRPAPLVFNHKGLLPANHPIRDMVLNGGVKAGLPNHFRTAAQIKPEHLAYVLAHLPRGLYKRNGDIALKVGGRINVLRPNFAAYTLINNPESNIARAFMDKLNAYEAKHPGNSMIRRLHEAMDALHGAGAQAGAGEQAQEQGGGNNNAAHPAPQGGLAARPRTVKGQGFVLPPELRERQDRGHAEDAAKNLDQNRKETIDFRHYGTPQHIIDEAKAHGLDIAPDGQTVPVGERVNDDFICNCYKHFASSILNMYGIKCKPVHNRSDDDARHFYKALASYYQVIKPGEGQKVVDDLTKNGENGTVIFTSEGGHAHGFVLRNGNWYNFDQMYQLQTNGGVIGDAYGAGYFANSHGVRRIPRKVVAKVEECADADNMYHTKVVVIRPSDGIAPCIWDQVQRSDKEDVPFNEFEMDRQHFDW